MTHELLGGAFILEALIPLASIRSESRQAFFLSTAITLAIMIFFVFFIGLLSQYFGGRVQHIIDFIHQVRDGDLKSHLLTDQHDELNSVAVALNGMTETLDTLVNDVYVANLARTEADLRLLQSQINPYMLYNSLASINNLIRLNLPDKACQIVSSLTDFYRLSLGSGLGTVTLAEEIDHVRAYVTVKTFQMPERVMATYSVSREASMTVLPKITLQPLVENMFKHALYTDRAKKVADSVWFCLRDAH